VPTRYQPAVTAKPKPKSNAPKWIKAFVALHVASITIWTLPSPRKSIMDGTEKLGVKADNPVKSFSDTITEGTLYLNWKYLKGSPLMYYPGAIGFWQYWDMFSPNPASIDLYLEADVEYRDGTVRRVKFPRIYTMPIPEKYVKERYRKYFENIQQSSNAYALPAGAQRLAFENFENSQNPPVKVTLYRFIDAVEPPGKPQVSKYESDVLFEYQVDLGYLYRDKGIPR
jgi:hypothetical protein